MANIASDFGEAGANLADSNGGIPTLADALRDVADDLATIAGGMSGVDIVAADSAVTAESDAAVTAVADAVATAVSDVSAGVGAMEGLFVTDPTTPSSQVTGAGDTDWNVDVSAGFGYVGAVAAAVAAAGDFNVHTGSNLLSAVGKTVLAWMVVYDNAGTPTLASVVGAEADDGSEVAPTDGEIDTALSSAAYFKLALCKLNRDGDTSVVQSQDFSYRKAWAPEFRDLAALANDIKSLYNANVTLANDLKAKYNANVTLVNDIKAKYNAAVTLLNQIKTELVAFDSTTSASALKTQKV